MVSSTRKSSPIPEKCMFIFFCSRKLILFKISHLGYSWMDNLKANLTRCKKGEKKEPTFVLKH